MCCGSSGGGDNRAPRLVTTAPAQDCGAPAQGRGAPARGRGAPAQGRGAPTRGRGGGGPSRNRGGPSRDRGGPSRGRGDGGHSIERKQPLITQSPMSIPVMEEGSRRIARLMGDRTYALMGGVALNLLGSRRGTNDFDIMIPAGKYQETLRALSTSSSFGISWTGLSWVNISNDTYKVDIVEPTRTIQSFSKEDTVTVDGVRILKPAILLNLKAFCWKFEHRKPEKKPTDAQDINFLVSRMAEEGQRTSSREVNFANPDFLNDFTSQHPRSLQHFHAIGLL
ncbi:MAG: hypothetical protein M1839_001758 [Geoglossum umbratile]|nr:MAG: hypothetical protein M1839_001758 [Geoglossum umbratile]